MSESSHETLLREACRQMLGHDAPSTREDWVKIINFVAWNVDFRTSLRVCRTIARLYEVPLNDNEIQDIVDFQSYDRASRNLATQERIAGLLNDEAIRSVDEYLKGRF